ncbi:hemerythrin domain-containing protein [Chitinimonas sp. PSY-7]|uniref:hemerythrin domain-containing protein n=1 Tax=Chitinimonas sp. PSY-7 TaxID=3459088 RepID=UPI0040400345
MTHQKQSYDPLNAADARLAILRMLKDDHQRLKSGFHEFAYLNSVERLEIGPPLIDVTCDLLEIYAALEEDIFYPGIRDFLSEPALVDEALIEHMTLKLLIAELRDLSSRKLGQCDAVFTVLGEYVVHHIHKEESGLFVLLGFAGPDWIEMLDAMQERRDELEALLEAGNRFIKQTEVRSPLNGDQPNSFNVDTPKTILH